MFTFIISLAIVVAVLLVLVVLSQNSKGGGLSSQFGGSGSSNQMIGVKRTTDLLEKLTWGLAIGLIVLTLSSSFLIDTQSAENSRVGSPNIDRAQDRSVLPNMNTDVPGDNADTTTILELDDLSEEEQNPQE
ncbi:preprotein translocase subunit SecG [Catalinimonas niigatensis]|uniref:preprotein translocase subunit SecG n=1 Tax=Catalinimonas niigatensis TaxID=1397264 RepID=UPI0026657650|nr:preprotein translocase subunit SecG [Catalinimonas niigatensis]WPP51138.1 preprotein translocase subunit SecG [Catalinimonas niigatensis]